MDSQQTIADWEVVYDKTVGTLVRECLTILEGLVADEGQRKALRLLLRRAIYSSTDRLKDDLVNAGLEKKQEKFDYPK